MAIGIYGGSFDPIHFGHLITTLDVKEKRNLEKVFFIPSYISPLKQNIIAAEDYHRFKMVELAIQDVKDFLVSDFEIRRKKISYTIETLQEFKKSFNDIELIIGFDNYLVFDKWYLPDEILNLAKVVVMKRQTENLDSVNNSFKDKMIFVDTPTIEISSTEIRNRVRNNLPIDFFVPQKVKEYIYKNGLYR
jgi:nicotinate-nucleotide adenylyltransferase